MGTRIYVHKKHVIELGSGVFNNGEEIFIAILELIEDKNRLENSINWEDDYYSEFEIIESNFRIPKEQLEYCIKCIENFTDEEIKEVNEQSYFTNSNLTKEEILNYFISIKNEGCCSDGYYYFTVL